MHTTTIIAVLCTLACFDGAQAGLGFGPCPSGPKPMSKFELPKVSPLKYVKYSHMEEVFIADVVKSILNMLTLLQTSKVFNLK